MGVSGAVFVIAGTRPEAIKLAPVVGELRARGVPTLFCATGQHRELFHDAAALFGLAADIDLDVMVPGQSVEQLLARTLPPLRVALQRERPGLVVVQGDTASAFAGALAAFYARLPLAHVEAGLRSGSLTDPFPEELHRRQIAQLATLHFAPTAAAKAALLREGVAEAAILMSGNTGVDALHQVCAQLDTDPDLAPVAQATLAGLPPGALPVLVTVHRRESHGEPLERILDALVALAARPDVALFVADHPHPAVSARVHARLAGRARLLGPLAYPDLVALLRAARLVLTDSGGIQEEAPVLGCPALVLRRVTERIEGLASGNARLVGTETGAIVAAACEILDRPAAHAAMASPASPYGDGRATQRICDRVERFLDRDQLAMAVTPVAA